MNDTTDRPLHQYLIRDLRIVELHDLAFDQTWVILRDLNIVAIRVDLSEEDRKRALGEALSQMIDELH